VVGSLVAAFARDPALRYFFPDEHTYGELAAVLFGYLFDQRVRKKSIWTIEGGASTAMWEPPATDGPAADDGGLATRLPADSFDRIRTYDHAVHPLLPPAPYWYLGVLGTRPDRAGQRWGRAVMAAGLERAATDGLPSVLETTNPTNVEIYRRAGWRVIGTATAPVPIWVMQH
jgi:ribosomal protein S18 acetylase RimI-like enzyme